MAKKIFDFEEKIISTVPREETAQKNVTCKHIHQRNDIVPDSVTLVPS